MTPSPDALPGQMRAVDQAYHAHDAAGLSELYSPSARLQFPGIDVRGRDAIREMWTAWFRAFPDARSEIHRVLTFDGGYALDWTETGTHRDRLRFGGFDIPATGRRLRWRGVSTYELGGEGITAVTYVVDRTDLALSLLSLRSLPAFARAGIRLWRGRDLSPGRA